MKKNAKLIKMTSMGLRSVEHAFDILRQLESKIAKKIGVRQLAELKKQLGSDWD